MTFDIHDANHEFLKGNHDQRYGQFLVNYLSIHHPTIYNQLPESADCFYDNSKCAEFLRWIHSLSDT